jgi:hypothetical protein
MLRRCPLERCPTGGSAREYVAMCPAASQTRGYSTPLARLRQVPRCTLGVSTLAGNDFESSHALQDQRPRLSDAGHGLSRRSPASRRRRKARRLESRCDIGIRSGMIGRRAQSPALLDRKMQRAKIAAAHPATKLRTQTDWNSARPPIRIPKRTQPRTIHPQRSNLSRAFVSIVLSFMMCGAA